MYIGKKWMTESEVQAYVAELEKKTAEVEDKHLNENMQKRDYPNLRECPFCGGEATPFSDNYGMIGILCGNCNLYFGIELECGEELVDGWRARIKSVEEAAEAWNRRIEK